MLFSYYHKSSYDLYICTSNIQNSGLGVFTKDFIPSDTKIDEYYGDYTTCLPGGEYFFRIDEEGGINAIDLPRSYMAMLNDAKYRPVSKRGLRKFTPHTIINNCKFMCNTDKKIVEVYSSVDIEPFSELFISYGKDYWN